MSKKRKMLEDRIFLWIIFAFAIVVGIITIWRVLTPKNISV